MNTNVISPRQLFSLMILYEFGTAIVIHVGLEANKAIWLAILLAIPGGVLLYWLYSYLFRQYPNLLLSGYTRAILGPVFSWPVSLFIIGYFMFNAARNLREVGDLLITSVYDETPLLVVNTVMVFVMIYVLSKGVEVFFRLAQIYLFIILLLGIFGIIVVVFSGKMEPSNLLPISSKDWLAAFKSAYPPILLFPFGEIISFTTVLPSLSNKQSAGKTGMLAIVISGVILSLTHGLQIMTVGESIYKRSTFPLLTTISIVDIANFLQRLDAVVMLTLIICVFFKMSMFCYAVMALTADLFRMPKNEPLAPAVGIVVLFLSIFSAWSLPEHASEGRIASLLLLFTVSVCIPAALCLIHLLKKAVKRKAAGGA